MDSVTVEFSGTETVMVLNIIGTLLNANVIKEDQIELIKNLHISIFEKLKPHIVKEVDASGVEVDASIVEVDTSGVEVDASGVEVDLDDGSGVGEYDGSGVEDCQAGVCNLEIPSNCFCDGPTDCSNN